MGGSIKIELTDNQRAKLGNGYCNGKSHSFRTNCQMVLLKSGGYFSKEIAKFLGFLYIYYLPRCSPHLNIVETLWRKLKCECLSPTDYQSKENLFCQIRLALTAVGNGLFIRFSKFRHTLY